MRKSEKLDNLKGKSEKAKLNGILQRVSGGGN